LRIEVRLLGMLRDRAPASGCLNLPVGASVRDVLAMLGVAPEEVHAVSVNGRVERDLEHTLAAADKLAVLPPVTGGCRGCHHETGRFE
jgi:molybdopterin converting factor small subunit